jgi:hypothetical protein
MKKHNCDWCNKRKPIGEGYLLGKLENETKDWFICEECNLKHDII